MTLPDHERAIIEESKLRDYLLNLDHPDGSSKAVFFRSCGFNEFDHPLMEQAIKDAIVGEPVIESEKTRHGMIHVVEGDLQTPQRGSVKIRTVWIRANDTMPPRLVTAYPA